MSWMREAEEVVLGEAFVGAAVAVLEGEALPEEEEAGAEADGWRGPHSLAGFPPLQEAEAASRLQLGREHSAEQASGIHFGFRLHSPCTAQRQQLLPANGCRTRTVWAPYDLPTGWRPRYTQSASTSARRTTLHRLEREH